ncbi:MAG: hypothetical protein Q4B14_04870 [Clostridia bacterium]|nr:hypothetical protein [Clostridia bacterium]
MKRYVEELIIVVLQLIIFFVLPLFAGPTDMIGMVLMIVLATLLLSFILGVLSNDKVKYAYPIIVAIVFIPSVFIYYNESALVHSVWYLVVAYVGLLLGTVIKLTVKKLK